MSNNLNRSYNERTDYDKIMNNFYNPTIESYQKRFYCNQLFDKAYDINKNVLNKIKRTQYDIDLEKTSSCCDNNRYYPYTPNSNPTYTPNNAIENLRICGTGNASSNSNSSSNRILKAVNYLDKIWTKKNYLREKLRLKETSKDITKQIFDKTIIIKFMKEFPADYAAGFKNTYADGKFPSVDKINGYEKYYDPYEKVFYNINNNDKVISAIIDIVKNRIEPITDLKFSFNSPDFEGETHIRISLKHDAGCWSVIGTDSLLVAEDSPTMNFAWFDVGTVLHEFGHVLGLCHEHQSPYGNPIIWNVPKLNAWAFETQKWDAAKVYTEILAPLNGGLLNGTRFDHESIMLYFYPKDVTFDIYGKCCGEGTTQNIRLSQLDVLYWNYLYPINYDIQKDKKTPFEFYKKVYGEDIDSDIIDEFYSMFYPDS